MVFPVKQAKKRADAAFDVLVSRQLCFTGKTIYTSWPTLIAKMYVIDDAINEEIIKLQTPISELEQPIEIT